MDNDWKKYIPTPALVLNYDLMLKNIETMAEFVKENNVNHRPHVKTHKCPIIAHMQLKAGCKGITVAKVGEAEIFAQSGIDDIFIANQVIDPTHIDRLAKLSKYIKIRCAVDSQKNIMDLEKIAGKNNTTLEVLLDINLGLGRSGVEPGERALEMANFIKTTKNLELVGLFGYEGHLTFYGCFADTGAVLDALSSAGGIYQQIDGPIFNGVYQVGATIAQFSDRGVFNAPFLQKIVGPFGGHDVKP